MSGVHSKNTRINMAGRLTEISNYKIPKGLVIIKFIMFKMVIWLLLVLAVLNM